MADIEIIIDQRDRVLGAIAPYFAQHPSWKHLVEALCLPFREIEDAIALLVFGQLVLKNATGVWLDRWGTVINQPRGGLADQEYRMALLGGFRGLMSTGNAEDMMGTWKSLMEDSGFEVSLTDIYPAGVILHALRGVPTARRCSPGSGRSWRMRSRAA